MAVLLQPAPRTELSSCGSTKFKGLVIIYIVPKKTARTVPENAVSSARCHETTITPLVQSLLRQLDYRNITFLLLDYSCAGKYTMISTPY